MALIDVDLRQFDPDRRPAAIAEAAALVEASGPIPTFDENTVAAIVSGAADFLEAEFPTPPDDVADYLEAISKYLSLVVYSIGRLNAIAASVENRLAALEG